MKNQKGITLVALVITIVVMLILVAVTVSVVVSSDLIGTAENAKAEWEAADDKLDSVSDKEVHDGKTVQDYLTAANTANK